MVPTTQEQLVSLLCSCVADCGWHIAPQEVQLDVPADERFGDISANTALRLSRSVRKPPAAVAALLLEQLQRRLPQSPLSAVFSQVKIAGPGFINFYYADSFLCARLREIVQRGMEAFRFDAAAGNSVLVEFVSANPTGPLSVAHARQAVVGDALAHILEFLGFRVQREYYLNDEGNQITILGNSVALRSRELAGEAVVFPENHYQGEYIYDIARARGTVDDAALADFAAGYILAIIKQELADFGVSFDSWFSQKALGASGKVAGALEALRAKGYVFDAEGAVWLRSSAFGDDKDRVVVKSDGSYTYLAPDIAYHQDKYERGFSWLINLWGPDHHGYISRLKASVAAFGHDPESLSIIIVQLATIFRDGKPVQMSTRRGQYITLREVLDEVGRDAARFFFLMRRTSSHLDFDLAVAKKETAENPVFYVQYAHARICSILSNRPAGIDLSAADLGLLRQPQELLLARKIMQLPSVLQICLSARDPSLLTVYLMELAETFHKFYDAHRVLGEEPRLSEARLCLLEGTRAALLCGLALIGVSAPEKMQRSGPAA